MASTPAPVPVFTRDDSSGRIHRRYRTAGGHLASIESDNLDDAGAYTIITEGEVNMAPDRERCRNCFPREPEPADPGVAPI